MKVFLPSHENQGLVFVSDEKKFLYSKHFHFITLKDVAQAKVSRIKDDETLYLEIYSVLRSGIFVKIPHSDFKGICKTKDANAFKIGKLIECEVLSNSDSSGALRLSLLNSNIIQNS